MKKLDRTLRTALLVLGTVSLMAGCVAKPVPVQPAPQAQKEPTTTPTPAPQSTTPAPTTPAKPAITMKGDIKIAANPNDINVLVNKSIMLPDGWNPPDLVEPNVMFTFKEQDEKRLMRKEAATALEQMFAGAKKDGIYLAGVSGYRSYTTQTGLFNYYVKTQGEELARRYSAEPGHSEHQTGLAMDVSGSDGKCAADDCFGGTPEATWLAKHVAEYGFIIRYPQGKEQITGYAYEPWHVRYVGKTIAAQIAAKGITLEEFYGMAG